MFFFPPFARPGSIDHVSIRQLQLILLKVALIIGCEFIENITFDEICPRTIVGLSNKENQAPQPPPAQPGTPIRKCSIATALPANVEEADDDEADGNVCSGVGAEEARFSSGTSDSEPDSDSDNQSQQPVVDEQEAVKQRTTGDAKHHPPSQQCRCCCHLHGSGDSGWSSAGVSQCGALAHFSTTSPHPATASPQVDYQQLLNKLHAFRFDVLLGADGRRNLLADHFPRKEFRGKLAIAITANFINTHTLAEAQIPEIAGLAFVYNQQLFK